MSQIIPIQTMANQQFTVFLEGSNYDITLKATNDCMSVNLIRDGVVIIQGFRVVAGTPIIPFEYLETGNFIFLTQNDDLPDYTKFNISQFLYYYSTAELALT